MVWRGNRARTNGIDRPLTHLFRYSRGNRWGEPPHLFDVVVAAVILAAVEDAVIGKGVELAVVAPAVASADDSGAGQGAEVGAAADSATVQVLASTEEEAGAGASVANSRRWSCALRPRPVLFPTQVWWRASGRLLTLYLSRRSSSAGAAEPTGRCFGSVA